jgi:hypothetical protein
LGAVRFVEPTAIAIATVAIDNPPKIHGRRSIFLSMAALSSDDSASAANMTDSFGSMRRAASFLPAGGQQTSTDALTWPSAYRGEGAVDRISLPVGAWERVRITAAAKNSRANPAFK